MIPGPPTHPNKHQKNHQTPTFDNHDRSLYNPQEEFPKGESHGEYPRGTAANFVNKPQISLPLTDSRIQHNDAPLHVSDPFLPDSFSKNNLLDSSKGTLPARDTSPVIFTTEVRHTVSAVISWSITSESCDRGDVILAAIPSFPTESYGVEYYPDGKPELRVEVNTTKNVLLLTGLQPDTRYRYTVHAYRAAQSQPQWSASDMLETSYKN